MSRDVTVRILCIMCMSLLIEITLLYSNPGSAYLSSSIKTKLGSPILWITGYQISYENKNSSNIIVAQTADGNINLMRIGNTGMISESHVFNVDASPESGGPVLADLDSDGQMEIVSVTKNGKMAIIEQNDERTIEWFNETKISSLTQPAVFEIEDNHEKQKHVLLMISENGSLLELGYNMINATENKYDKRLNLIFRSHDIDKILSDTRITVSDIDKDENFEIQMLSYPVTNYPHGALGDNLEPSRLQVLERCGESFCLMSDIIAPKGKVFETISPLYFSASDNDTNDILNSNRKIHSSTKAVLVTSDKIEGSGLSIYNISNSSLIYSGQPIGHAFRWMLVLGTVEDITTGHKILVVNKIPHLSGIIELIDPEDVESDINGIEISGYSAHNFGSRNIAMFDISDIDNDKNDDDLIIPNLEKDKLEILSLINSDKSINRLESLHLSSPLSSNIYTTDINGDDSPDIIAGDQSGALYLFESE